MTIPSIYKACALSYNRAPNEQQCQSWVNVLGKFSPKQIESAVDAWQGNIEPDFDGQPKGKRFGDNSQQEEQLAGIPATKKMSPGGPLRGKTADRGNNNAVGLRKEFHSMPKTKTQNPLPARHGDFWTLRTWVDTFKNGTRYRVRRRLKLCSATCSEKEARTLAKEELARLNSGLVSVGGGVNFQHFAESRYMADLQKLATTTQNSYQQQIHKHLLPRLGKLSLSEIDRGCCNDLFADMLESGVGHPTVVKIKDALSSILRSAVDAQLIMKNPLDGLKLAPDRRPKEKKKTISPEELEQLVSLLPEPYASMIYVCAWTGLRPAELVALKWGNVGSDSITVEASYGRGEWTEPKTDGSAATIAVSPNVIARLERLKHVTVDVKAGYATRHFKAVKGTEEDDLIFPGLMTGKNPIDTHNALNRFIKPAVKKLGLRKRVTWRLLRTAHATWLVAAGADPKSVQGQMRHADISTTMNIYAQIVPEAQRQAIKKLGKFAGGVVPTVVPTWSHRIN